MTMRKSSGKKSSRQYGRVPASRQFAYHFHVVGDTLIQPFGLQRFAYLLEVGDLFVQVVFYLVDGACRTLLGGHEQVGRINAVFLEASQAQAAHRVDFLDGIDFIVPERDAQQVVRVSQVDVHRVAFHAEAAPLQVQVVPGVEAVHQFAKEYVAVQDAPPFQFNHIFVECGGVPHAVDAADGRHHHHVFPSG